MPWADKEKNRAAVRDWMHRNRERANANKRRWRARQRALRALEKRVTVPTVKPRLPLVQRRYFKKLRRNGVPLVEAQRLAYGA